MESGQCYQNAYAMLCGYGEQLGPLVKLERNLGGEPLLVHGYPRLTSSEYKDRKYGHAWLHLTKLGLIVDGGTGDVVQAELYIKAGRINVWENQAYNRQQALKIVAQTQSYGPWGDPPKGALFKNDNHEVFEHTGT